MGRLFSEYWSLSVVIGWRPCYLIVLVLIIVMISPSLRICLSCCLLICRCGQGVCDAAAADGRTHGTGYATAQPHPGPQQGARPVKAPRATEYTTSRDWGSSTRRSVSAPTSIRPLGTCRVRAGFSVMSARTSATSHRPPELPEMRSADDLPTLHAERVCVVYWYSIQ